ncbi:hypothetical protein BDK51DRAFT_40420 [Blyttiomyces helicus]|uniref:Uncharacterized protein n=1 Tax=Blyttiomyces helicus TaxID=388810 RepID=A0A4P9WLJ9_9FUNG|nr:hypothetical protein BDK51DRAFT_40420 [Blyttiomyces helicus]|eukprot:RKO93909.1 hypothetical protein BDK51DRAFT_40420 [Blyttiomyces helicus]
MSEVISQGKPYDKSKDTCHKCGGAGHQEPEAHSILDPPESIHFGTATVGAAQPVKAHPALVAPALQAGSAVQVHPMVATVLPKQIPTVIKICPLWVRLCWLKPTHLLQLFNNGGKKAKVNPYPEAHAIGKDDDGIFIDEPKEVLHITKGSKIKVIETAVGTANGLYIMILSHVEGHLATDRKLYSAAILNVMGQSIVKLRANRLLRFPSRDTQSGMNGTTKRSTWLMQTASFYIVFSSFSILFVFAFTGLDAINCKFTGMEPKPSPYHAQLDSGSTRWLSTRKNFHRIVAEWIVAHHLHFAAVKHDGFVLIVKMLEQDADPPCCIFIISKIRQIHTEISTAPKLEVNAAPRRVSLALDAWISPNCLSFHQIYFHFINLDWDVVLGLLDLGSLTDIAASNFICNLKKVKKLALLPDVVKRWNSTLITVRALPIKVALAEFFILNEADASHLAQDNLSWEMLQELASMLEVSKMCTEIVFTLEDNAIWAMIPAHKEHNDLYAGLHFHKSATLGSKTASDTSASSSNQNLTFPEGPISSFYALASRTALMFAEFMKKWLDNAAKSGSRRAGAIAGACCKWAKVHESELICMDEEDGDGRVTQEVLELVDFYIYTCYVLLFDLSSSTWGDLQCLQTLL